MFAWNCWTCSVAVIYLGWWSLRAWKLCLHLFYSSDQESTNSTAGEFVQFGSLLYKSLEPKAAISFTCMLPFPEVKIACIYISQNPNFLILKEQPLVLMKDRYTIPTFPPSVYLWVIKSARWKVRHIEVAPVCTTGANCARIMTPVSLWDNVTDTSEWDVFKVR